MKLQICTAKSQHKNGGVFSTVELAFDNAWDVASTKRKLEQLLEALTETHIMVMSNPGRKVCIPFPVDGVEIVDAGMAGAVPSAASAPTLLT
jgi:hypothetical protein